MTDPASVPAFARYAAPRLREWIVIVTLAILSIAYLLLVIRRVTVHGFGDVQVFFRAGWAIWSGYPLYGVTDDHGWAYHYTPTFALMMTPFANPLPGQAAPAFALPYPAAIAVWYLIGLAALFAAAHVFANALTRALNIEIAEGYWLAWWALRLGPVLTLAPVAGDSLGRGQPTALIALLMAGFLSLYAEGRKFGAAFALSLAIAIKMFPLALAFIPFLRRDFRTLWMIAGWCVVLLFVVPAAFLGVQATVELYRAFWNERLAGILSGELAPNIVRELSPWAADTTSIGAMLGRIAAGTIPDKSVPLPVWAARVQLAADFVIVFGIAAAGCGKFWRWPGAQPDKRYSVLVAGALLMAAMPALLPTAQTHYWTQAMPLVAVMAVAAWRRCGRAQVSPWLLVWSIAAWFSILTTEETVWRPLQVIGLSTPVMLALVAAGFVVLWRSGTGASAAAETPMGSRHSRR
jgi:hypothetical protein